MGKDKWLADLTHCVPPEAIARDGRHGSWQAVDYEVDEGKGTMLFALPDSDAPPLTLKLSAAGWHEIRLGMHCVSNARLGDQSYSFTDG